MNSKLRKSGESGTWYLLLLIPVLFIPAFFVEASNTILLGIYVVFIAALVLPVFNLLNAWWVPLILGLIILLPGPMDRMFISVQLTPEAGANPYGIFSVIDVLMLVCIFLRLKSTRSLHDLFNPRINYLTISLIAITLLSTLSALLSYLKYPMFHFPMAFRAVFYSIRFLLVFAWVSLFFDKMASVKKMHLALFLVALGFFFLALLSPKENYEGGNRLSVATYGVNTFGHLLAFTCLFSIPFLTYFNKTRQYSAFLGTAVCLLMCFVFLMMSANRMSFLLLLFGIGLYYLLFPFSFRKKLKIAIGSFVILAIAISLFALIQPELFGRIFGVLDIVSGENAVEDISELQARFVVWNISLEMILEDPLLGVGPGQWNYYKHSFGSFPPWMTTILDPHNGYLLYASEMGLICLCIYYGAIIYTIRSGFKTFGRLKKAYLKAPTVQIKFYMSFFLMLSIIICCWLLADLSNASGLNIRVQSLMWSFCCILFQGPALVNSYLIKNK